MSIKHGKVSTLGTEAVGQDKIKQRGYWGFRDNGGGCLKYLIILIVFFLCVCLWVFLDD